MNRRRFILLLSLITLAQQARAAFKCTSKIVAVDGLANAPSPNTLSMLGDKLQSFHIVKNSDNFTLDAEGSAHNFVGIIINLNLSSESKIAVVSEYAHISLTQLNLTQLNAVYKVSPSVCQISMRIAAEQCSSSSPQVFFALNSEAGVLTYATHTKLPRWACEGEGNS